MDFKITAFEMKDKFFLDFTIQCQYILKFDYSWIGNFYTTTIEFLECHKTTMLATCVPDPYQSLDILEECSISIKS